MKEPVFHSMQLSLGEFVAVFPLMLFLDSCQLAQSESLLGQVVAI